MPFKRSCQLVNRQIMIYRVRGPIPVGRPSEVIDSVLEVNRYPVFALLTTALEYGCGLSQIIQSALGLLWTRVCLRGTDD